MPSGAFSRLAAAAALCFLSASFVIAAPQRQLIGMSHDHLAAGASDCAHFLTTTATSFAASAHAQEQRELSLRGLDLLRINAGREGGIVVRGWDKPGARLIVCKYAAAASASSAQALLANVTVRSASGAITANGPDSTYEGTWWVNMILYVPRKAKLDIASENGAIAIRNMAGKVTARATNGGISVADCSGEQSISTVSGGISLEKIGGRLDATTTNGPIAFKLHDRRTPDLEASTENGGEIVCNATRCADVNWAAGRKRMRLGDSAPSIRLSTESAPIIIDQVR